MKILVTGGAGFLGSHVADALQDAGHEVVIFDRAPSPYLRTGQTMVVADILDPAAISAAMAGCQAVYHLAALADIDQAINRPLDTIQINVIGTLNTLEAARQAGVHRFVFSSSIYVFSNQGSFYRTSKQAAEHLIHNYYEQFGLCYTILRYGSLYGPRADPGNAVFSMLTQALTRRRIDYGGTGREIWEYIHITDAAALSVDVLDPEFSNQIIHLTGRERMTTSDMLDMIREILGGDVEIRLGETGLTGHYTHTPYNYTPKLGRRLSRKTYIDLGLGLLDCIHHIDGTHQPML